MKDAAHFLGRMVGAWVLSLLAFPFVASILYDVVKGEVSGSIGGSILATIFITAIPVLVFTLLAGIPIILTFREINMSGWALPFAAGISLAAIVWGWSWITGGLAGHGIVVFMAGHAATVGLIWGALDVRPTSEE